MVGIMKALLLGIILVVSIDLDLPKGFEYLDELPVINKEECVAAHLLKCECFTAIDIQNNRIYSITVYKKKILFIHEESFNGSIELYPTRKFIL